MQPKAKTTTKRQVIGIDCGGTFIKAGLLNEDGEILEQASYPTNVNQGVDGVLATFEEIVTKYKANTQAVGIGFAAPLDAEAGIILEAVNFPKEWHNFPLVDKLTSRVHLPVYLANDAKVAALGEYWKGAGANIGVLVVLTLGTGVGGGIIIQGKVWSGATGIAGELGHIHIGDNGPLCGCGKNGCLETLASSTAVVRMAQELGNKLKKATKLYSEQNLTAAQVYQIAMAGDEAARSIFNQVGQALGKGIATMCHILGPQCVVLTGGGAGAWELFYPPLYDTFNKMTFQRERDTVKIVRGVLGDKSGLLGAAYLALQKLPK